MTYIFSQWTNLKRVVVELELLLLANYEFLNETQELT